MDGIKPILLKTIGILPIVPSKIIFETTKTSLWRYPFFYRLIIGEARNKNLAGEMHGTNGS